MANRIPEAVIDEIRSQTNIVDVIGQSVQLKKAGKNLFGICPFHDEKTPSFSVNEEKQIFHCFSCGRGGNVFKFLMDLEQLSFPEAVIKTADFIDYPLTTQYRPTTQESSEVVQLKRLYQQANDLLKHILTSTTAGQPALDYLKQRGLTDEQLKTFEIGYLPPQSDLMLTFFKNQGVEYQALRQSGLFVETQSGELHDRFTNRVMFPIRNPAGEVIAFSGRLMVKADNQPKYLNSPETAIFNKRRVLFNYDLAKPVIHSEHQVYLFEGFMDVIAAYSAGITNGVASMGTSLTEEQLNLLAQQTHELVVCYDGDRPGIDAMRRAIQLLSDRPTFQLGVVVLPGGVDPDEFVRQNGPEQFVQRLKNGVETPIAFELRYLKQDLNLSNEKDQLTYIQQALRLITNVDEPVELELYLQQIASMTQVSLETLKRQLQSLRVKAAVKRPLQPPVPVPQQQVSVMNQEQQGPVSRIERAEQMILAMLMQDDDVLLQLENNATFSFVQTQYQLVYELWRAFITEGHAPDTGAFLSYIPADLQSLVVRINLLDLPNERTQDALNDCLAVVAQSSVQERLRQAKIALREATRLGDQSEELKLTNQIIQLVGQMQ